MHAIYDSPATWRLTRDAANGVQPRTNGINGANGTLSPINVTIVLFTGQAVAGYDGWCM
ncbi:MAG: hypothetical protein V4610_07165 [Pseudomonadota bacterium]